MPIVGYCRNLHTNLCPCFLCSKKFSLDNGIEDLLTHICFTHRVVIDNIDRIADFKKYMEYYVKRFKGAPLESFTRPITIEVTEGSSEPRYQKYYLLGDFLPEDEDLRRKLHAERLKAVKRQQRMDLETNYFWRHCLFCHTHLELTNAQFVNHLRNHGFQLGRPEKLVYIGKFIEAIEDTFVSLRCLYCEMELDNSRDLIHHMEKKGHFKIHPNNRFYDQFYMINYLEFGKTWLDFAKEKKSDPEQVVEPNDDPDWSNWGGEPENIICLFCDHVCRSWDGTLLHMQVSHNFDFKSQISRLSFYEQVKVVNYIRRRIFEKCCISCDFQSENKIDVMNHMEKMDHLTIPDMEQWDHDEYFFCALKDDMLLCHLEDNVDENGGELEEKGNPVEEVDIARPESESGPPSSSQSTESELEHVVTSINESEDNLKNPQNPDAVISVDVISNGIELSNRKTVKLCSSAHIGAGDSAQEIDIPQEFNVKKMNESGDA